MSVYGIGATTEPAPSPARAGTSVELVDTCIRLRCGPCGPRSIVVVPVIGRSAGEVGDRLAGYERAHALCGRGVPR